MTGQEALERLRDAHDRWVEPDLDPPSHGHHVLDGGATALGIFANELYFAVHPGATTAEFLAWWRTRSE